MIGRYSPYWLVVIIIFGVYLQVSKALVLNLLIQSDQGEWEDIIDYEKEEELMNKYSSIMKISVLAFIIFSFYFGIELIEYAELTPKNWNGYSSIIGGFVLGVITELIVEYR